MDSAFQKLKPPCVALNQAFLSFQGRAAPPSLIISRLETLLATLKQLDSDQLNPKLAEYVFVPLSYILRASQQLPVRAIEVTFQCLAILIQYGWRDRVAGPLGAQLLILFSITGDQSQKNASAKPPSDELLRAVFDDLAQLFHFLGKSQAGQAQLLETSAIPRLGHSIAVLLDGLDTNNSQATQLSAIKALDQALLAIDDHEVLVSFLPGVVSNLTKVLTLGSQNRRSPDVLIGSLGLLNRFIRRSLRDDALKQITGDQPDKCDSQSHQTSKLNAAWAEATAGQLKLALSNINRLHSHAKLDVRTALFDLNSTGLRDCSKALSNCRQMSLETLVVLQSDEALTDRKPGLVALLDLRPQLLECLELIFRDWVMAMPRLLEGADEDKKVRRLKHLFTAYDLIKDCGHNTFPIEQLIAKALPEYVSAIFRFTGSIKDIAVQAPAARLEDLPLVLRTDTSIRFSNVLANSRFQSEIMDVIQTRLRTSSSIGNVADLARDLASAVRQTTGEERVSNMWLSFNLVQDSLSADTDDFLVFPEDDSVWKHNVLEDLYDFSLTAVGQDSMDWRVKALGLEVIAAQSVSMKQDFRNELIDALYPVLHLLGSEKPRLRQHAMVCLNIITQSCGYEDVKQLIVSNADYLVNAVALKLNSYDVSPQGPQVLLMMVKLAGAALVPYLEDTIDSIFAILDDYHGYTSLVELFFSVLKAICSEGAQELRLQIEAPPSDDAYPDVSWQPTSVESLAMILRNRKTSTSEEDSQPTVLPPETNKDDQDSQITSADPPTQPPPKGKTYPLLLRISSRTQHYLPSSSPSLRLLLLKLLKDIIPTIALHENSYLPLINTLWPEVIARLNDRELQVQTAALDVMRTMTTTATGFLGTRIKEVWPLIRRVYGRLGKEMSGSNGKSTNIRNKLSNKDGTPADAGSPLVSISSLVRQGRYIEPSTVGLWTALKSFLLAVVQNVAVREEISEDVLSMLEPIGALTEEERRFLETVNADAVWLAMYRKDKDILQRPQNILDTVDKWRWAGLVQVA